MARSEPYYFIGSRAAHPDSKRTPQGYMAYNFDPIPDCITSDVGSSNRSTNSPQNPSYNYNTTNQYSDNFPINDYSTTRHTCSACGGMGRMKVHVGTMAYTSDSCITYICGECNEIMHTYDKHIHQTCSGCYGKGYY